MSHDLPTTIAITDIFRAISASLSSMNGPENPTPRAIDRARVVRKSHVIGSAPKEYRTQEGKGRTLLKSDYQLTFSLRDGQSTSSSSDSVVVELFIEQNTQDFGIEERIRLPILGNVEHCVARFEHEAWLWKMGPQTIEQGSSMIRNFRTALDALNPDLNSLLKDAKPLDGDDLRAIGVEVESLGAAV